jgi:two-component system nitrogen regulation response regulator GlnG
MITLLITENEQKVKALLSQLLAKEGFSVLDGAPGKGELYKAVVGKIERALIENMLERTEGNQLKAARLLGINRNTIRSKIRKLGIDAKKWKAE